MSDKAKDGFTLTALGCGNMGIAILSGILASLEANPSPADLSHPIPARMLCCVRTQASADRIIRSLKSSHVDIQTVLEKGNVPAVHHADVVLLGCKPHMVNDLLRSKGMYDALQDKLLISVIAGFPTSQIEDLLSKQHPSGVSRCTVLRATPNTAAEVRESMTIICTPSASKEVKAEYVAICDWMFSQVGDIIHMPQGQMDACGAMGSAPAFFALFVEAMTDAAVAMGIPRADAAFMVPRVMRGSSGLLINGEHPAVLKDKVCSPGGSTIAGIMVLEEGAVRGNIAKAFRESASVTALLGKGIKGVNGTRN